MPKLKALKPSDRLLRQAPRPVSLKELRTKKIQSEIEDLLDFVYQTSNKGTSRDKSRPSTVGLSANQVGLDLSIIIVDLGIGHKSYNDIHALINPKITWSSKTTVDKNEGCVNLDFVRGFVKRSSRVKIEAYDRSGNKISLDVHGWAAALIQHEIDHLNGRLFIDRLDDPSKAHLVRHQDLISYKRLKKHWDKFVDVTSLVKKDD